MIRSVRHRGPDGTGFWTGEGVGLAHARLSIVDLAGGAQPIHNEDRSVWVTFNGEIFNHVELRRDLKRRGHTFYTESDTEVIVHLYEEHGDRFVDHLNGQFAIGLWDARQRRLLLVRDRAGIRPLFFTEVDGRLLFASEIKALFSVPGVRRELDPAALAEIFHVWGPLGARTPFDGVRSIEPGQMLIADAHGLSARTYWDWNFEPGRRYHRSEDECAEELRSLLVDAVQLQLRADVPVGAYLSGGLDSSIITSLIRERNDVPLRTFSLTFDDAEFDEASYQQTLVERLRTEHSSIRISAQDIADAFPRTIWHTEAPVVRTAPTPLMLLSEHVHQRGYKVVLTGEGTDEVFGGYDLFKEAKIRRFMAREPESRWRGSILQRLYPYLRNSPVSAASFTQRFFADGIEHAAQPWFAHHTRMVSTARAVAFLRPEIQERLARHDVRGELAAMMPAASAGWEPMARDQYVEAHTLLAGYLLNSQGDRVAMANSVEGRVPFLDHRVIEFANRLPSRYKIRGLLEKAILKRAVRGVVPERIRTRVKQPYRAPDGASFFRNGRLVPYAEELLSSQSVDGAGIFDAPSVARLVKKFAAGRAIGFADNMAFVGIVSTMLLHRYFVEPAVFDASGPPAAP